MNKSRLYKLSRVFVLGAAAFSLSSVFAAPTEEFVTPSQIASAHTSSDHETIAKAYESEAAVYDKKIEQHKAMEKTYAGAKSVGLAMGRHCDRLATNFESTAQEYRAMAAEHRAMAKRAK